MNLTPRLKCVADKVKKGSYPADIGTDHAYLPICLIKDNICSMAVATDVRSGPLKRAEENVKLYNLQDKIIIRKGSGLVPLLDLDVDCAILSGMGGYLISKILDDQKEKALEIEYFVMQPVQAPEAVRKYLYENSYRIVNEQLVKENDKIYTVIVAEHGADVIEDDIYFEIGKKLIENKDPLLEPFIEAKINEMGKIINKIADEDSVNARLRVHDCLYKLKRYKEVLKCL